MKKDGDALAADDSAAVVVPPPKTLSVLLVTDGNYFLQKAIHSLNLQHPDEMTSAEYEGKSPAVCEKYDVILFDRYTPKTMPAKGNFVFFGAVPSGLKAAAGVRSISKPREVLWR